MTTLMRISPFRNAYLIRGALTWVALRLAAAFVEIYDPVILQEVFLLGLVALAVALDARRRGEDLFLANLGVPLRAIALSALPVALVLELLVP
jgi:hypothetical protein